MNLSRDRTVPPRLSVLDLPTTPAGLGHLNH